MVIPEVKVVGNYTPSNHEASRIIDADGLAPTFKENHGTINAVLIKNNNSKGYLEATDGDGIDISSRMEHYRGTVQKGKTQTLTTMGGENNGVVSKDLKIRKLTPKECFRLMGVKDEDYKKVAKNQSNASLYHLAGDSIVTLCLMAIIGNMCGIDYKDYFRPDEWWKNN